MEPSNQNLAKFVFFLEHSETLDDVMQKQNENLEFVQSVNFEFIYLFKNNGTKYLIIFDHSNEEICNWKAFVDVATAGRPLDCVLNTSGTTCSIKANQGKTLSAETRTLFLSSLSVMWCKSVRLVPNWDSDHS